jgi:hypothetical protein
MLVPSDVSRERANVPLGCSMFFRRLPLANKLILSDMDRKRAMLAIENDRNSSGISPTYIEKYSTWLPMMTVKLRRGSLRVCYTSQYT